MPKLKTEKLVAENPRFGKLDFTVNYGILAYPRSKPKFSFWCEARTQKDVPVKDGVLKKGSCVFHGTNFALVKNVCPQFLDIARLNNADITGVPAYAVDTAWYYISEKELHKPYTEADRVRVLSDHLRIPRGTAGTLVDDYRNNMLSRRDVEKFIDAQKPRWKREAEAVIVKYGLELTPDMVLRYGLDAVRKKVSRDKGRGGTPVLDDGMGGR